jgi:hypothetical protein
LDDLTISDQRSRRAALKSTLKNCERFIDDIYPNYPVDETNETDESTLRLDGGFAKDFEEDSQKCPDGAFLGVVADRTSCGFSGNMEVARDYCDDFKDAPCCSNLADDEDSDSSTLAAVGALGLEGESVAVTGAGGGSGGFIVAAAGALICVAAIIGGAVVVRRRRRHSHSRIGEKKSGILGMTASPSSSAGSSPTGSPDQDSPRYVVIHEYASTLPDELELRRGDIVTVGSSFDDSWCLARNITTGKVCDEFILIF